MLSIRMGLLSIMNLYARIIKTKERYRKSYKNKFWLFVVSDLVGVVDIVVCCQQRWWSFYVICYQLKMMKDAARDQVTINELRQKHVETAKKRSDIV